MVSDSFQGGCVCENAAGLRHRHRQRRVRRARRPPADDARRRHRRLDRQDDDQRLPGDPRRLLAGRLDRPRRGRRSSTSRTTTTRPAATPSTPSWAAGCWASRTPRAPARATQQPEKPEDLWTFDDEHPAPADRKTPEQLEADLIKALGSQIDALAPARTTPPTGRPPDGSCSTSLKVRVGLANPPPRDDRRREVRAADREGLTIVHSQVGRKAQRRGDPGRPPDPDPPERPADRHRRLAGQGGAVDARRPAVADLAEALLDRGQSVVGFDPLFVGESIDPATPVAAPARRRSTSTPTTRRLAADQMQDLATVAGLGRGRSPTSARSAWSAWAWPGLRSCWPGPLLDGLARTVGRPAAADDGDGSGRLPPALDLPGLFQFGGLKAAAALSAPAPLWIVRPGPGFAEGLARGRLRPRPTPRPNSISRPKLPPPIASPGGSTGVNESRPGLTAPPGAPGPCSGRTSRRRG